MVKFNVGNFLIVGIMAALFILLLKSVLGTTPDNSVTEPIKKMAFAI